MKHYFLDTNVMIDFLAKRQPFWADAAELMQTGVNGETQLYVASLSFSNVYYILCKECQRRHCPVITRALRKTGDYSGR